MAEIYQVKCDACGFDLTYTANAEDWFLAVGNKSKNHLPGNRAVSMMLITPPIDRTHHFCGLGCLSHWMAKECPGAAASYEAQQKRRAAYADRLSKPNG